MLRCNSNSCKFFKRRIICTAIFIIILWWCRSIKNILSKFHNTVDKMFSEQICFEIYLIICYICAHTIITFAHVLGHYRNFFIRIAWVAVLIIIWIITRIVLITKNGWCFVDCFILVMLIWKESCSSSWIIIAIACLRREINSDYINIFFNV